MPGHWPKEQIWSLLIQEPAMMKGTELSCANGRKAAESIAAAGRKRERQGSDLSGLFAVEVRIQQAIQTINASREGTE